jgi:hypothetical protein
MKKLSLFVGAAIGFVLGSRMGREPYERLEAQVRQLAGRPEVKGAMDAVSDKAAELTDTVAGAANEKISRVSAAGRHASSSNKADGPTGSISHSEIDAETDAALDNELKGTFPTSDAPSSWAGPDNEPERPKDSPT